MLEAILGLERKKKSLHFLKWTDVVVFDYAHQVFNWNYAFICTNYKVNYVELLEI